MIVNSISTMGLSNSINFKSKHMGKKLDLNGSGLQTITENKPKVSGKHYRAFLMAAALTAAALGVSCKTPYSKPIDYPIIIEPVGQSPIQTKMGNIVKELGLSPSSELVSSKSAKPGYTLKSGDIKKIDFQYGGATEMSHLSIIEEMLTSDTMWFKYTEAGSSSSTKVYVTESKEGVILTAPKGIIEYVAKDGYVLRYDLDDKGNRTNCMTMEKDKTGNIIVTDPDKSSNSFSILNASVVTN